MIMHLLCEGLARQHALEGRSEKRAGIAGILARLFHPRFLPIVLCRASRSRILAGIPFLPRIFSALNLIFFGLEVTPSYEIEPGIFFPHAVGTVIRAFRLGSDVTVFQGVTLGARELDMHFDPGRPPEIGHNVTLGSGCKILGPISIGNNTIVGANAVVARSVEPNARVKVQQNFVLSQENQ
jgi:serine O-acetyltransferase